MKRNRLTVSLAVLAMLASACAPSMTVQNDFDRATAFNELQTFDWAPSSVRRVTADPVTTSPFLDGRIREAIEAEMIGRGFRRAASGQTPDMLLAYYAAVEEKLDIATVDEAYGWRGSWTRTRTDVDQYAEGTLVIDVADARTNRAIWRGWGQGAVTRSSDPEKNQERLRHAVGRILAEFPPQAGN